MPQPIPDTPSFGKGQPRDPGTYTGDFSSLLPSRVIYAPSTTQVAPAVLFKNCPGGVAPAGIVQGSPFPGNKIPSCLLDANAQALLAARIFQKPNGVNDNGQPTFAGGGSNPTNVKDEIARVDHQFGSKFSIFGHWVSEQIRPSQPEWINTNQPAGSD